MYPPKVVNVGVSEQYKEWQRSSVLTWSHGRTACRAKMTSAHELHTLSLPSTAHVITELRLYSTMATWYISQFTTITRLSMVLPTAMYWPAPHSARDLFVVLPPLVITLARAWPQQV